jgi:uncharacterized protein (TIRG00374 family)
MSASGSAHESAPRMRPPWWRYARPALFVLVTGVSLYLLLPSLLDVFSSWRSLADLTWYWAALSVVCEAGSFVCLWELNRIALHDRSWFVIGGSQLAGSAVGKIVPGGGATATAFTVSMLRRAGRQVGQAAAALTATSVLQVGTRLALPLLALPAILGGVRVAYSLAVSAYLGIAVLLLVVVAGVLAFAYDRPLELVGRAVQWLLNATVRRKERISGLPRRLLDVRDFVRATLGRRWRAAVVAGAGATTLDFLALLCALRAVGAQPQPSLVLLAFASAGLLALIPLTPGGLGFVEAGLVGTLTLAGVSAPKALVATLAYRLASYWLPIPAGGIAYLLFHRRYP